MSEKLPGPALGRLAGPAASLADQAAGAIRQAVRDGGLRPGQLYSAYQIADYLGVSRSPVREALMRLAEAGLVAFERNRGFRIVIPGPREIAEVFHLRLLLEVPAARQAAAHVADRLVASRPAARNPAARNPAARNPTARNPTARNPTARNPAARNPAARDPAARDPVADEPGAGAPVAGELTASEPAADAPEALEPAADAPGPGEPAACEPTASEPTASEPTACGPAAGGPVAGGPLGAELVAGLRDELGRMRSAAADHDEARFMRHDQRLHALISAATGNSRLVRLVDSLRDQTRLLGASTVDRSRNLDDIAREHEPIVAAIAAGDPAAAGRAMAHHISRTGRLLASQVAAEPGR